MNELYGICKEQVRKRVRQEAAYTDEAVRKITLEVIGAQHRKEWIPLQERIKIGKKIFNGLRGLDVLQPILEDEAVTDIMVNGADHIYFEKNGQMIRSKEHFESEKRLEDLIQQIVGSVNRSVNEANPIVDARLADGSRVHVVLPPVALNGPVLTIRRFRKRPITIEDLVQWETLNEEMAKFLKKAVEDKKNIFVCGGTASGKTTLLNVLSNFIPWEERIITIEDAAELRLAKLENVVTLETRNGNAEGKGKISMRELIRASLRMNPDRIIVGEVRGAEALDMLQAMNTGHDGSLTTVHANSPRDVISRLETMVLMSGMELPSRAIREQIQSAVDIIIHESRLADGSRKVTAITEVTGMEGNQIVMQDIFAFKQTGVDANGKILGEMKPTGAIPTFMEDIRRANLDLDISIFTPPKKPGMRGGV